MSLTQVEISHCRVSFICGEHVLVVFCGYSSVDHTACSVFVNDDANDNSNDQQ